MSALASQTSQSKRISEKRPRSPCIEDLKIFEVCLYWCGISTANILCNIKKNIKKGWSSYAMVYSDIDFTHAASSSSAFSPNFKIASDHIEARHLGKPINTEGTAPTSQACSTERCQIILERLKSIDLYPSIVSWSFRQVQIIPGTMSGIPCL